MKAWTALGTLGIVMTFSSTSWADNFVKLTEQQIELNNQAIEAQQEGDLLKAQKLIESMILLGETDVAWLQLGRIYEMQKKCIGAMDAYDHAKRAPSTMDVPHDVVLQKMLDNEDSLRQTCSSVLVFDCKTPNMTITVDDDLPIKCNSEPHYVTEGRHNVHAKTDKGSSVVTVTLSLEKTKVMSVGVAGEIGDYDEEVQSIQNYSIAGWSLLGGGVAIATVGGVILGVAHKDYSDKSDQRKNLCNLDPLNDSCRFADDANSKYKAGYALIGVGSAVAVAGAALLVIWALKDDEMSTAASDLQFTPYFGIDNTGFELTYHF